MNENNTQVGWVVLPGNNGGLVHLSVEDIVAVISLETSYEPLCLVHVRNSSMEYYISIPAKEVLERIGKALNRKLRNPNAVESLED